MCNLIEIMEINKNKHIEISIGTPPLTLQSKLQIKFMTFSKINLAYSKEGGLINKNVSC